MKRDASCTSDGRSLIVTVRTNASDRFSRVSRHGAACMATSHASEKCDVYSLPMTGRPNAFAPPPRPTAIPSGVHDSRFGKCHDTVSGTVIVVPAGTVVATTMVAIGAWSDGFASTGVTCPVAVKVSQNSRRAPPQPALVQARRVVTSGMGVEMATVPQHSSVSARPSVRSKTPVSVRPSAVVPDRNSLTLRFGVPVSPLVPMKLRKTKATDASTGVEPGFVKPIWRATSGRLLSSTAPGTSGFHAPRDTCRGMAVSCRSTRPNGYAAWKVASRNLGSPWVGAVAPSGPSYR